MKIDKLHTLNNKKNCCNCVKMKITGKNFASRSKFMQHQFAGFFCVLTLGISFQIELSTRA